MSRLIPSLVILLSLSCSEEEIKTRAVIGDVVFRDYVETGRAGHESIEWEARVLVYHEKSGRWEGQDGKGASYGASGRKVFGVSGRRIEVGPGFNTITLYSNVHLINSNDTELFTEILHWDVASGLLYSDAPVRVKRPNGFTQRGTGLRGDQRTGEIKILKSTVIIDDD